MISIKDMTIKELKNVLTDMDLPTSGNKTKLIQRIVSNQNIKYIIKYKMSKTSDNVNLVGSVVEWLTAVFLLITDQIV